MRRPHIPTTGQTQSFGWATPVALAVGILLGGLAMRAFTPNLPPAREVATAPELVRASAAGLSHPFLTCANHAALPQELAALRQSVAAVLDSARANGLTRSGAFIVDLEACQSFELGAAERFHPASLLKLPTAMAWLRRFGANPEALRQELKYDVTAPVDPTEDPNAACALKPGASYPVERLLKNMLVDSRNDALWLLEEHLPPEQFDAVWRGLGLSAPDMTQDVTLSARDLGLLFEALYDGTSLGPEASELALSWLSTASWRDGLLARLPAGAVMAHKFGRRVLQAPGLPADVPPLDAQGHVRFVPAPPGAPAVQLSDCGILYHPGRPMLVCVMTEGLSDGVVTETLQRIGSLVWNWSTAPR